MDFQCIYMTIFMVGSRSESVSKWSVPQYPPYGKPARYRISPLRRCIYRREGHLYTYKGTQHLQYEIQLNYQGTATARGLYIGKHPPPPGGKYQPMSFGGINMKK
jgi:hypothetical protein